MTLNPAHLLATGACLAHDGRAIYRVRGGELQYWCDVREEWQLSSYDGKREMVFQASGWRVVDEPGGVV